MTTNMENTMISEGSNATNENSPDIEMATLDLYTHKPPKPMGTRPCSPSESDICVCVLPPPAYHASLDVLPAAPVPTATAGHTESVPAQDVLPAAAPAAISAPAPAVIASTPPAVQSSSMAIPAQPAPGGTRGQHVQFDIESGTPGGRRRHYFVDNAAVRGVRLAGGTSVRFAQDLNRRRPGLIRILAFILFADLGIFFILLIVERASRKAAVSD